MAPWSIVASWSLHLIVESQNIFLLCTFGYERYASLAFKDLHLWLTKICPSGLQRYSPLAVKDMHHCCVQICNLTLALNYQGPTIDNHKYLIMNECRAENSWYAMIREWTTEWWVWTCEVCRVAKDSSIRSGTCVVVEDIVLLKGLSLWLSLCWSIKPVPKPSWVYTEIGGSYPKTSRPVKGSVSEIAVGHGESQNFPNTARQARRPVILYDWRSPLKMYVMSHITSIKFPVQPIPAQNGWPRPIQ